MQIIDNIPVWGTQVDEGALKQIRTCYWIFGQAAMMADHHKGYGVPIGGVIAHVSQDWPGGLTESFSRTTLLPPTQPAPS